MFKPYLELLHTLMYELPLIILNIIDNLTYFHSDVALRIKINMNLKMSTVVKKSCKHFIQSSGQCTVS